MAKVKDLGLNLMPSKLPKKVIVEPTVAEEITQKIHATTEGVSEPLAAPVQQPVVAATPAPIAPTVAPAVVAPVVETPPVEVEELKKTSFDFPMPLYKAMKRKLVDDNMSMRDYVLGLIRKDLDF